MLLNPDLMNIQSLPGVKDNVGKIIQSGGSGLSQKDESGMTLSPLAQISVSSQITDLTMSDNQTSYAYYKDDNSMALRAQSQTDVHLHEETYNFDITFSAEALGLSEKDFSNHQPMVFKFSYKQQEINTEFQSSTQVVKQIRSAQDVLNDLSKALRDVLRDTGNKTVVYQLDDEARQALLSDPKITKLVNELIMLMASINLAKKQGEVNNYTIKVSGKAKPLVDYQEKTNVDSESKTVNMTIKINPPEKSEVSQSTANSTIGSLQTSNSVS